MQIGYQFESGRTVSAAYQHVKDILTDGPIHIVYNTEHKYLYFSYVKVKMYENYTIKDVNNLIMVE